MAVKTRLVFVLLRACACLPLTLVHAIGSGLGILAYYVPNKTRRVAALNLQYCFPDYSQSERKRLLRASLIEAGKTLLETGPLWFGSGPRMLQQIIEFKGEQAFNTRLAQGRGLIALTPHLGAWEAAGLYIGKHYALSSLYRPSRLGALADAQIQARRGRLGARLVPTNRQGVRALVSALQAGEVIGILPDQEPREGQGIFAPFFGVSAYTMVLLSRLALKHNSPVFVVFAERLARGRGYRIHAHYAPQVSSAASLQESVNAVNAAIEEIVRQWPEQYLWTYKRFKTPPPGTAKRY